MTCESIIHKLTTHYKIIMIIADWRVHECDIQYNSSAQDTSDANNTLYRICKDTVLYENYKIACIISYKFI